MNKDFKELEWIVENKPKKKTMSKKLKQILKMKKQLDKAIINIPNEILFGKSIKSKR